MSKTSKIPWETVADGGVTIIAYGGGVQVIAPEICGKDKSQAVANAALIVRAVNSHEALVKALNTALTLIDRCEAALALAKEQP